MHISVHRRAGGIRIQGCTSPSDTRSPDASVAGSARSHTDLRQYISRSHIDPPKPKVLYLKSLDDATVRSVRARPNRRRPFAEMKKVSWTRASPRDMLQQPGRSTDPYPSRSGDLPWTQTLNTKPSARVCTCMYAAPRAGPFKRQRRQHYVFCSAHQMESRGEETPFLGTPGWAVGTIALQGFRVAVWVDWIIRYVHKQRDQQVMPPTELHWTVGMRCHRAGRNTT